MPTCPKHQACPMWNPCELVNRQSLTPDELHILVRCTLQDQFGNGYERELKLGRWYTFVQGAINMGAR